MENHNKRKNCNYGVKSITLQNYLNDYFNPFFEKKEETKNYILLSSFYKNYFGFCTHKQFLKRVERLKHHLENGQISNNQEEKMELILSYLEHGKEIEFDSLARLFTCYFSKELEKLCYQIVPLSSEEVKEADVLKGKALLVRDHKDDVRYYQYHCYLFDYDEETLFEREARLSSRKKLFLGKTN